MLPRNALHNPDELAKLDRETDDLYAETLEGLKQICRLERKGEQVYDLEAAIKWTELVQSMAIKVAEMAQQLETLSNQAIWLANKSVK